MPESFRVIYERNVPTPMRDGTVLYADIYRPDAEGTYPVLLQRTPYNKSLPAVTGLMGDVLRFAGAGYVVVVQDTRGRYASEGDFSVFAHEVEDGYDTVEWCAAQPWSNGKVGMFGASYVGATQWLAALARPPHLVAIAPVVTASDYHDGWTYQGGAFALGFNLSWTLAYLAPDTALRRASALPDFPQRFAALVQAIDHLPEVFRRLPLGAQPELEGLAPYYFEWLAHPDIDLWATSNLFKAGHRVRVEVSSSNFPRFDRNPNTGRPLGADADLEPALQRVFHDADHPSRITLPVIATPPSPVTVTAAPTGVA